MSKFIKRLVVAVCLFCLIGSALACQSSPCDELAARCSNCASDLARASCELGVEWDIDDACQDSLDDSTFAQSCPE